MTKQEFLAALASALERIPESERNDILRDYEEYFIDAQLAGRTATEVIDQLGQPTHIAKQLIADHHLSHAQSNLTLASFLKATLAVGSLTFFNIVFVLGPLIGIIGMLVGMWVASIALIATPIVYVFALFFNLSSIGPESIINALQQTDVPQAIQQSLMQLGGFASIAASGFGIIGCVMLFYISRWFIRMFIRYMQANVSILRGSTKS
jgi:uncharacterized membrane protein